MNFVGENAVDAGGLSREFWQLLVRSIGSRYCCSERGKMFFDTNTPALRVSLCFAWWVWVIHQPLTLGHRP